MPGILEERLSVKNTADDKKNSSAVEKSVDTENKSPVKENTTDTAAPKTSRTFHKSGSITKERMAAKKERVTVTQEKPSYKKEDLDAEALSREDAEILSDLESIMSEEEDQKDQKKNRLFRKIGVIIMSLLCVYMIMLIYGAATTEYRYNEAGEVEPVVLSVDDIQAKNEFSSVLAMYLQTRELYETILTLDYRMASGVEDSMGIAPEYESALDTVSTLAVQIDASDINSRYNQIKSMLLTWIQTHCAAYCQFMSAAITQNDNNAAAEAIAAREVVNSYFQQITMNIVSLGDDMGLFDLDDIKEWSPDAYVKSTYEGLE